MLADRVIMPAAEHDGEAHSRGGAAQPFLKWDDLVLCANNKYYLWWMTLNTFCCLTSSYFYAYLAAFHGAMKIGVLWRINSAYETNFAITMVLSFFVEFQEEGQQFPVRDINKIAKHYLSNRFLFDFIPILPLQWLDLGGY